MPPLERPALLDEELRRKLRRLLAKRPELLDVRELQALVTLADDLALLVRARDVARAEQVRRNEMGRIG